MSWGAVAGAVGSVALGAMTSGGSSAPAQKDTRVSSIDQILSELITKSEQNSEGTSDTTTLEEQIAKQLSESNKREDTTQTGESTQSGTVSRGDSATQEALAGIISGGADGEEQISAVIDQILRSGKAGISNVGTRSGSFGSTTEQLLNNDLIAKAAAAGVNQQNILDQKVLQGIELGQKGTETSTESGASTNTGSTVGKDSTDITSESSNTSDSSTKDSNKQTTDTSQIQDQTNISDSFTDVKPSDLAGVLDDLVKGGLIGGEDGALGGRIDLEAAIAAREEQEQDKLDQEAADLVDDEDDYDSSGDGPPSGNSDSGSTGSSTGGGNWI